jgi:hypothetical protein
MTTISFLGYTNYDWAGDNLDGWYTTGYIF